MKIRFLKDGPILIEGVGAHVLRSGSTERAGEGSVALCRCGRSANKPFCDGTHREAAFRAAEGELDLDAG